MNHYSHPLTVVQINIFEEPQNIFPQPKSQTPNYQASPPPSIFNYRVPPRDWSYFAGPLYHFLAMTIKGGSFRGTHCLLVSNFFLDWHHLNLLLELSKLWGSKHQCDCNFGSSSTLQAGSSSSTFNVAHNFLCSCLTRLKLTICWINCVGQFDFS